LGLVISPERAYITFIDFGRTIGLFRHWHCRARVRTFLPNID
jgi:hypothetical protein